MTVLLNSFEGGTNGTTVTAGSGGNSGGASGSFVDVVTKASAGTVAFSSTEAAHGSLSCKVATGASASSGSYVEWSTSWPSVTTSFGRAYIYQTAAAGTTDAFIQFQSTSGWAGGIQLTTAKKLLVQSQTFATVHTMTSTLPLNAWFRIEWELVSSASVGQITLNYYASMDSGTATESYTSPATQNFGANCNAVLFGWTGAHTSQPATYIDDLGLSSTGFLGPSVAAISDTDTCAMTDAGQPTLPGGPQFVQLVAAGASGSSASTLALTVSAASTMPGNVVGLSVRMSGGKSLSSVTDSRGNTWQVDANSGGTQTNAAAASAELTTALVSGDTVTLHFSGSCIGVAGVAEYSGVLVSGGAVQVDTGVSGTTVVSSATATVTTGSAAAAGGDLVVSCQGDSSATSTSSVAALDADSGGSWATLAYAQAGLGAAYQLGGVSGSTYQAVWTAAGGTTNSSAVIVAYLPGSATTPVSDSDTSSMADAGSVTASLSSAETPGVVADAGERLLQSSPDTSSMADAGSVHASLSSADTATGTTAGEAVRLSSADTSGPETDAGERISLASADTSTGTTAGELVTIPVSSTDTFGAEAEAGSVHASLSSADTLGTVVDAGEHVAAALSSSDSSAGTTAGETIHVSSADVLGTVLDAGEAVRTGVSSADTFGAMADAGEHVAASLSSADTAAGTTAGEAVAASLSSSDSFGAMTETGALVEHVSSADAFGTVADAGEFVSDHFSSADTSAVTTAGEKISLSSADTSAGTTAGEAVRVVSADACAMADAGESVGTRVTDADSCLMVDSGFSYVTSADTCAMAEAQQVSPQGAETSQMSDLELSNWPSDGDTSTMADAGNWSGSVVDGDTSTMAEGQQIGITDVFPFPGGDSSVMTDTYTPGIGVYTFVPAWDMGPGGGLLRLVWEGRELWRGVRPDGAALELARTLAAGDVRFADDSDSCQVWDNQETPVGVSLVARTAMSVVLEVTEAPLPFARGANVQVTMTASPAIEIQLDILLAREL